MTPEQLKASILQYAIQGKLVEQRKEEGTATDFLNKITEVKSEKIKKGEAKKSKTLTITWKKVEKIYEEHGAMYTE